METLMQASSILALFETTKSERLAFVNSIIESVIEGKVDPLQAHLQVKAMEEIIKTITDNPVYKDAILDEAMKYGKTFTRHNAEVQIKEVGVKYDYSNCGDPTYELLAKLKADIDAQLKEREAFLKAIPKAGQDIITPEGEVVNIFPPSKSSITSVTVKLK